MRHVDARNTASRGRQAVAGATQRAELRITQGVTYQLLKKYRPTPSHRLHPAMCATIP